MVQSAPDRFLSWSEVRPLVGISRTTAWRLERDGKFPLRFRPSPGRCAWRESEILRWQQTHSPLVVAA